MVNTKLVIGMLVMVDIVWGGMQYRTGLTDSPIGSYAHSGNFAAWAGWRQNGWVPIDRTKNI